MTPRAEELITLTPQGLYCPPGDFFIDPVRPVARAVVTHGHADHARPGHDHVLATAQTLDIMALRYGANHAQSTQSATYGETLRIGDVDMRFVPAGHVLGSAQIVIERAGLRLVITGDYKRGEDPTCAVFECVPCDVFVSEATFGLPVFRHPPIREEIAKLIASTQLFPDRAHLVGAYALGKAQRMIALLRAQGYDRPIWLHGALEKLSDYYISQGVDLGPLRKVAAEDRTTLAGEIVICPPSAMQDRWSRKFPDPIACFASGWMRVRARARQKGVALPLVVSDHADWDDLIATIRETGAGEVWLTHGEADALAHWCAGEGIAARPLNLLGYGEEEAQS
jgi:putative mRNA 3-end processing factor